MATGEPTNSRLTSNPFTGVTLTMAFLNLLISSLVACDSGPQPSITPSHKLDEGVSHFGYVFLHKRGRRLGIAAPAGVKNSAMLFLSQSHVTQIVHIGVQVVLGPVRQSLVQFTQMPAA